MTTRRAVKASRMKASSNSHGRGGSAATSLEIDDPALTSTIEDRYRAEREQTKVRHWKESDYAAGLVEPTWAEELERHRRGGGCCCGQLCQEEIDPGCGCIYLSALVCSRLGAGRIGNMAVLKERYVMVEVEDEEGDRDGEGQGQDKADGFVDEEEALPSQQQTNDAESPGHGNRAAKVTKKKRIVRKREIQIIVGPFWPMLLFITYPLIFVVSGLTLYKGLPGKPLYAQMAWALMTGAMIRSLFNTGFRDPGMLFRRRTPPAIDTDGDLAADEGRLQRRVGFRMGNQTGPWSWSDQAQTYRPRNSMFCPDCKVIIEDFDHTCPWTGTAIGKKNMASFQCFVGLVFACLIVDIVLLTVGSIEYA